MYSDTCRNADLPQQKHGILSQLANSTYTPWFFLFFLVISSHVHWLKEGGFDDLSVLRASSYMTRLPNNPLISELYLHLEAHKHSLDLATYNRFLFRLEHADSYMASNMLVGLLERRLPLCSSFQSVVLSNLIIHLFSVTTLFLIIFFLFRKNSNICRLIFLLSLSTFIFSKPHIFHFRYESILPFLFPFNDTAYNWAVGQSRGFSLTFFLAALLLSFDIINDMNNSLIRIGLMILFLVASLLSHSSTVLLFLLPTFLILMTEQITHKNAITIADNMGIRRFNILLFFCVAVVGTIKLLLFITIDDNIFSNLFINEMTFFWFIEMIFLVHYWLRVRKEATLFDGKLIQTGDLMFRLFLPFAIIAIGLNLFHPNRSQYWNTFLFTEASRRITGFPHIAWWFVFGVGLFAIFGHSHKKVLINTIITILLITCLFKVKQTYLILRDSHTQIFNKDLMTVSIRELLSLPGTEAYSDDIRYFNAIANELMKSIPSNSIQTR